MANLRKRRNDPVVKADSLENALSRKGTARSKIGNNQYRGISALDHDTIRDIYNSGGIGAKVITRVADDITRKGFRLPDDKDGSIMDEFDELGGTTAFNTAIRWARAYGGALIVMIVDDGMELTDPLDTGSVNDIERLETYEAGCTNVVTIKSYYEDSRNVMYGRPEIYSINSHDGARFDVHESRCVRIDGRVIDSASRARNQHWNGSELQPVYESLLSMMSQLASGEEVLNEMVIGTLKLENLDAMCVDSEGEALVQKRLELIDTSKSNENSVVIDLNEEYERHTVNLSGMSNIQHNAMIVVAGASDIPATYLFGTSPDGQNATGASDKEQYYGKIDAERQYLYKPALSKIIEIISGQRMKIIFPSMSVSSLYDTSRSFEHFSKGLQNLIESGIITAQEARERVESTRFVDKIAILE